MSRITRKRMSARQMMWMFIALSVFIVAAVIFISGQRVVADAPERTAYYRSVTVQKGDSLWSIAEEFAPASDNRSLSAYVEDLRSINHLRRDASLQIGQSLLVAYYSDAAD